MSEPISDEADLENKLRRLWLDLLEEASAQERSRSAEDWATAKIKRKIARRIEIVLNPYTR